MDFTRKKIVSGSTLGSRLIEARLEQGIDLEQAAKDLNISYKYLYALENDNLADLPGVAYVKNFLDFYCQYLNLDFKDCWKLAKELDVSREKQKIESSYFLSWPKFLKRFFVVVVVAAVLFFLVLRVQAIFSAPFLEISSPDDGLITTEQELTIVGRSEPEAEIIVNNKRVFTDNQGDFEAAIDLQKGLNLIKITARKKYGKVSEKSLRILLREEVSNN